jgi:4-alpha-glucanotransferase
MLDRLSSPSQEWHPSIRFTYWLQYHLHLQLARASRYAASRNVALKGDLPIGGLVGGGGGGTE